jgi:hypothetical protein
MPHLFSEFALKDVRLKNRIVVSPRSGRVRECPSSELEKGCDPPERGFWSVLEQALRAVGAKSLKRWSGRRGSNPRRPAWEQVGWMCLQQLSVSGALYGLTASLAISAFSSPTPSNRGFFEVQCTVIRTSICAAFHGIHSRVFMGPDKSHGSPLCLVHFLLRPIAAVRRGWRPLPRYFNSNTPAFSSPSRN